MCAAPQAQVSQSFHQSLSRQASRVAGLPGWLGLPHVQRLAPPCLRVQTLAPSLWVHAHPTHARTCTGAFCSHSVTLPLAASRSSGTCPCSCGWYCGGGGGDVKFSVEAGEKAGPGPRAMVATHPHHHSLLCRPRRQSRRQRGAAVRPQSHHRCLFGCVARARGLVPRRVNAAASTPSARCNLPPLLRRCVHGCPQHLSALQHSHSHSLPPACLPACPLTHSPSSAPGSARLRPRPPRRASAASISASARRRAASASSYPPSVTSLSRPADS